MRIWLILGLALWAIGLQAAERGQQTEDTKHVKAWNNFADKLLAMHEQVISTNKVKETTRLGRYRNDPPFYKEHAYHDAKTGKLLSRVQWEIDNPKNLHVLELFLYDDKGRLKRDYTVAFLPGHRNAPSQTVVTLYGYNGKLKAFRNFDANGEATYESCDGDLNGQYVQLSFEDFEIADLRRNTKGISSSAEYKACFNAMPLDADKVLPPTL